MAFNSTIGASMTSYCSLADADNYHTSRLHNTEWTDAAITTKEAALMWATKELDRMSWKGAKSTSTDNLRWPRSGVVDKDGYELPNDTIPTFLIDATSELAFELIKKDRYADRDSTGIRKVSAGAVAVSFDRKDQATRNPVTVMRIIAPYLNKGDTGCSVLLTRA